MNFPNAAGKTPLHLACEADKPECVKALLCAGADVNVAATHDSTLPIHTAMAANSTLCAKEIIKIYPNQLNVKVRFTYSFSECIHFWFITLCFRNLNK